MYIPIKIFRKKNSNKPILPKLAILNKIKKRLIPIPKSNLKLKISPMKIKNYFGVFNSKMKQKKRLTSAKIINQARKPKLIKI